MAVVRKPAVMLAGALVLYWNSEQLLGVVPLKPYELGEILSSRPEAALACAGTVVAVASVLAFKRVKRLDLELAAGADIALILRDAIDMMTRLRSFCIGVYQIRRDLEIFEPGNEVDPSEARRIMDRIAASWQVLQARVPQLRKDQSDFWRISNRLIDVDGLHSTAIRARAVTPYALSRAQKHALVLAEKAGFPLPGEGDDPGSYLDYLDVYEGTSLPEFLHADEEDWNRFLEWMGFASSIGSSAVALPSAITSARMVWAVLRMRD